MEERGCKEDRYTYNTGTHGRAQRKKGAEIFMGDIGETMWAPRVVSYLLILERLDTAAAYMYCTIDGMIETYANGLGNY